MAKTARSTKKDEQFMTHVTEVMHELSTDPENESSPQDGEGRPRAAIYARVSSAGQLGRDGDADGYSIPAQVEACKREAEMRGAAVAQIYVERAESARSADRPVLQKRLADL